MNIAIMQPYFFPYIGYFQLVAEVDKFIFYDDVHYIKRGWINRNRIVINGEAHYLTVPLHYASQKKLIKDICFNDTREKLSKTIEYAYKRAPFYKEVWPVLQQVLQFKTEYISELAIKTIIDVSRYLNIETVFEKSSEKYSSLQWVKRSDRIIGICQANKASSYMNLIGGEQLYDKKYFKSNNIELSFIQSNNITYKHSASDFVPQLSIIDVLMWNEKEMVKNYLKEYTLS